MTGFSGVFQNAKTVSYNEGLRRFMLGIYNYMSIALGLSAFVAFVSARTGLTLAIMKTPLGIIVAFSPLAISLFMGFNLLKAKLSTIKALFISYAVLMGVSMSTIFYAFSGLDITRAFLITACTFFAMSIYGYTTKKDLSSWGSLLIMLVFGLLISSIANMFFQSTAMSYAISLISVVVFTGLIAFDTQSLRRMYYAVNYDQNIATRMGIYGALQLYIDFVALFLHMLRIFGGMKNRD